MDINEEKELCYIHWVDSFGCSSSWESLEDLEAPRPLDVYSVGWVVLESDTAVTLVPHIHGGRESVGAVPSGCGDMTIPKLAIMKRVILSFGGDNDKT